MRILAAMAVALALLSARAVAAATITVNTTLPVDDEQCTITSAVLAAETDSPVAGCVAGSGPDVIVIPAGRYTIYEPYELDYYGNSTAFPFIDTDISIEGAGPDTVIERYPGSFFTFRFFTVRANRFTIRNLTLNGGHTPQYLGGALLADTFITQMNGQPRVVVTISGVVFDHNRASFGGAVADDGYFSGPFVDFNVADAVFTNNQAVNAGGGIHVRPGSAVNVTGSLFDDNDGGEWGGGMATLNAQIAPFTIVDSAFRRNRAIQGGGAIFNPSPQLTRVTFEENSVRDGGGALYSYGGRPIITDSTFTRNTARRAGAIQIVAGSVEVRGSTFYGNEATDFDGGAMVIDDRTGNSLLVNSTFSTNKSPGRGGALYLYGGGIDANNLTVTRNVGAHGGGLSLGWWGGSSMRLANSIVAGNEWLDGSAFDLAIDANEQFVSKGYNVIGTDLGTRGLFNAGGDHIGTEASPLDPGLLDIADNGGPTPTHALAPFGPALDAGSPSTVGAFDACEATDQRGRTRPGPGSSACDVGAYEHGTYYVLQLTVSGGGSVTGFPGVASCTGLCTAELGVGTVVTLTAQPNTGFVLTNWAGVCSGSAATCEITVTETQTVAAAFAAAGGDTITTLMTSPNPSAVDEEVTLTATVTPKPPAIGTPTGVVRFLDTTGPTIVGTVPLDSAGRAVLRTTTLPQGFRTLQAIYDGDTLFMGSVNAPLSHIVGVIPNVAPSFAMPSLAPAIDEDASAQRVEHFASAMIVGPGHESAQQFLGFAVTPVNVIGDVSFTSGPVISLDGALTYEVAPGTNGFATFRVTLQDDGGTAHGGHDVSAPQDFTITVHPVNDPPVMSLPAALPLSDEDAGVQTVPQFASVLTFGHANESGQTVAGYAVTLESATGGLTFASLPAIDSATGTLAYAAAPDANGSATFTVTLRDSGGTARGGLDSSLPGRFTITVRAVNDAPVLTAPGLQQATDRTAVDLAITATDIETDTLTFAATGLPPGLSIDSTSGRITGTPEMVTGEQKFVTTVTVTDTAGASAGITFGWLLTHEIPPPLELSIAETVWVSDHVVSAPALMLLIVETVAVTDAITPQPAAQLNIVEIVRVDDTISHALANTGTGSGVVVRTPSGVTLTFDHVDEPGTTTAEASGVPDPAAGFEHTSPPAAFDIRTTARFAGNVSVCLDHPVTPVPPRLMHYEVGQWVDRTASRTGTSVCGVVSSLSPFAVFVPAAIPGRMHGEGTIEGPVNYTFAFRVAERELGDERGRLELTITTPRTRTHRARRDVLRSTEVTTIAFVDEPGFRPAARRPRPRADAVAFAGTARWNGAEGHRFEVIATDRGEPGRGRDTFRISIYNATGHLVASVEDLLSNGNIQSQRLGGR